MNIEVGKYYRTADGRYFADEYTEHDLVEVMAEGFDPK